RQIAREAFYAEFEVKSSASTGGKAFGRWKSGIASVVLSNLTQLPETSGVTKATLTKMNSQTDAYAKLGGQADDLHIDLTTKKNETYVKAYEKPKATLDALGVTDQTTMESALEKYQGLLDKHSKGDVQPETLQGLGALFRWIDDKNGRLADPGAVSLMTGMIKKAADMGAESIHLCPQSIALRYITPNQGGGGRCLPLVTLGALAEASGRKGMDGMIDRLSQEAGEMMGAGQGMPKGELSRMGDTEYGTALKNLHGGGQPSDAMSGIRADGSRAMTGFEIAKHNENIPYDLRKAEKEKLTGITPNVSEAVGLFSKIDDRPLMMHLSTGNHAMLIGATAFERDGQVENSYVFYDPNLGVVRFETEEQLKTFLKDYFSSDLITSSYNLDKAEPRFGIERIDTGRLGAPPPESGFTSLTPLTKPKVAVVPEAPV
ncbi:MAG: hypothetical protein ACAI34_04475, partial [Verrucomicrobium sp.]